MTRMLQMALLAGIVGLGLTALNGATGSNSLGFVSSAEARVGRPLTYWSVAGVARRTVRRCAVGIYHC
jgi:hypothetical protein